jgi:hypothetical protein
MQYQFVKVRNTPRVSAFFEEIVHDTYNLTSEDDVKKVFKNIKLKGEQYSINVKDSDANALIDILANLHGDEVTEETITEQFLKYFEI